jgi:hypothetical protein
MRGICGAHIKMCILQREQMPCKYLWALERGILQGVMQLEAVRVMCRLRSRFFFPDGGLALYTFLGWYRPGKLCGIYVCTQHGIYLEQHSTIHDMVVHDGYHPFREPLFRNPNPCIHPAGSENL